MICEKIYSKNIEENFSQNVLETIYEYNLIPNYEPKNIDEFRTRYKFYGPIYCESYTNDLICLRYACMIKNNVDVVKKLIKVTEPDNICLEHALAHPQNKVTQILLEHNTKTKVYVDF